MRRVSVNSLFVGNYFERVVILGLIQNPLWVAYNAPRLIVLQGKISETKGELSNAPSGTDGSVNPWR